MKTREHEITLNKFIIEQLAVDNNLQLPFDEIIDLYFTSIIFVYKNEKNSKKDINYKYRVINDNNIGLTIYEKYSVIGDEIKEFDKNTEIPLANAKRYDKKIEIHDVFLKPIDIRNELNRSSLNKIKSMFAQKCNAIKNEQIYEKMEPLIGKIVIGTVDHVQRNSAKIKYENVYGYFPSNNQVKNEKLQEGKQIELLVENVVKSTVKTFPLIFSRNSEKFLIEILKDEVPEIADGIIQIRKVARMPGIKSKVLVSSNEALVDSVGSCLGKRGDRVNSISRRCSNERIDIVKWYDDIFKQINALFGSVTIYKIIELDYAKGYKIIIDDDDLHLAIGKFGSNVKLIRQLLNTDINIITLSEAKNQGFVVREEFEEDIPTTNNNEEEISTENNDINTKSNENEVVDNKNKSNTKNNTSNKKSQKTNKSVDNRYGVDKKSIQEILNNDDNEQYHSNLEEKLKFESSNSGENKSHHSKRKNKKKYEKSHQKENILDKIHIDDVDDSDPNYEEDNFSDINEFDDDINDLENDY